MGARGGSGVRGGGGTGMMRWEERGGAGVHCH